MKDLVSALKDENIFYITPDVKRGIGLEEILPNYHIICTFSDPLIPILRRQGAKIFCLAETIDNEDLTFNNSGRLLEHPKVSEYIKLNANDRTPGILAFKPSLKIESVCQKNGYKLLINKFFLNDLFEDKTNFFKLVFKNLPQYLIPGQLGYLNSLDFSQIEEKLGLPFVVQFSHGWAGKTTFFIKSFPEFYTLAEKFPRTFVRVNKFIEGITLLNNACIYKDRILSGPPALQISNIPELLEKPGVTCGRQWSIKLDGKQNKLIKNITEKVGSLMMKTGFKGFFGLDFLVEKRTGRVYLTENNARFTASAPFYTKLELGRDKIPLMIYHLACFLGKGIPLDIEENEIFGSQIIFRNPRLRFNIKQNVNYAVVRNDLEEFNTVRFDYYPQNLKEFEFIFTKRSKRSLRGTDSEIARIETKGKVLESIGNLKKWVKRLIK